jgi:signal transduction histidine kinase
LALIEVPQRIQIRNYTEEIPEIKVDTGKIYRVFVNLVKNAIDAMPENGVLTILSTKSEKTVEIVFKDNGIGMSEETLSHIWQPLFTTKAKGMGFGLSICKRIIEAHRGQILVKSKIGEGTEFTVVLPKKI